MIEPLFVHVAVWPLINPLDDAHPLVFVRAAPSYVLLAPDAVTVAAFLFC